VSAVRARRPRARRGLRLLAGGLGLGVALPIACVVGAGLVQGRDLGAGWRALRAPLPEPVAAPVALRAAPYAPPLQVGSLLDPELVEVSGLAASRRAPGVLWAVNDGGNEERLYALSLAGETRGAFDVDVGEDRRFGGGSDWEALAAFRHAGTPYLLIADVGDNWSWRRSVRLWIVVEPDLGAPGARLVPRARIDLTYADGARDCEAVAVDEADLTVLLVSKRTAPPVVYAAALAPLLEAGGGEALARPLAALALPPPSTARVDALTPAMLHMPTALDLAPDGSAALVLSYAAGWRFPRNPGEGWAEAFSRAPEQLPLPPLALAEAAAYVGESIFVTSEVERLALVRWRAPLVRFDRAP
jgi:hypothetical protein